MEVKKKFVINAAFYAIILAIVVVCYQYILPIMIPFIIGFFVASVVQVPLKHLTLEKPAHMRFMAIVMCLLFYVLLVSVLTLFVVFVVAEIGNLVRALPELFQTHMYPFFLEIAGKIQEILGPIDASLTEWLLEIGKSVATSLASWATDISAGAVKLVASGAVSIPGIIVQIILTVVSSCYISVDYRKVLSFLKTLIPKSKRGYVIDLVRYAKTAVLVYIKSYSLLFTLTFVELWIGLSILRIPYSLGIAFGIAVFDLMPVLGTGGVLLPWAVILLFMKNFPLAIGVFLLYIIITAVRNAVEPRIVGDQIGLHPLATLVAMMLGLKLVGLMGMILFPISLVAITNFRKKEEKITPQNVEDSLETK